MLRFKLSDLPPRLREQAERQLSQNPPRWNKPTVSVEPDVRPEPNPQERNKTSKNPGKVRPPITMVKRNEQSSAERRFNADFLEGRGKFEAVTLHLPGGSKYTGDFLVTCPQIGMPVICEVKGSYRLQSHARAATAFKTACAVYPEFTFCWAEQEKGGFNRWKVTLFHDGQQYSPCFEGSPDEIKVAFKSFRPGGL